MNTLPAETKKSSATLEQRMAKVGRNLDELVARAEHAKVELQKKEKAAAQRGEAAIEELKIGLDNARHELNEAWHQVCSAAERAGAVLLKKERCSCHDKDAASEDESSAY